MIKHLCLIRHGEPEEAYGKRFLGRLDPGLSPRGEEQARLAGERLKAFAPGAILASPLRRAGQTAAILAASCGLTAASEPLLLEIDFGELEGMTFAEASAMYPGITDSWQALAGDFSFPGGECFGDFNRRCRAMAERMRDCPERRIALVAHGGVLRGILCNLLGIEANGPLRFRLAYAALATVELDTDGGGVLTGFNVGCGDAPQTCGLTQIVASVTMEISDSARGGKKMSTIPDPAAFIGQRCVIRLKNKPMIMRTIISIDAAGVKVEEQDGGASLYPFSEIAMVSLEPPRKKK